MMATVCRVCEQIHKKQRRLMKMNDDVQRWTREGNRRATIEKTLQDAAGVQNQIEDLLREHDHRAPPAEAFHHVIWQLLWSREENKADELASAIGEGRRWAGASVCSVASVVSHPKMLSQEWTSETERVGSVPERGKKDQKVLLPVRCFLAPVPSSIHGIPSIEAWEIGTAPWAHEMP
ncbi:hypothetical protein N0V88_007246 [Collariella sp. IMI 366227]|nr:hypothetical protein N0V88_007246 [Collariella sp. IMI 366227]